MYLKRQVQYGSWVTRYMAITINNSNHNHQQQPTNNNHHQQQWKQRPQRLQQPPQPQPPKQPQPQPQPTTTTATTTTIANTATTTITATTTTTTTSTTTTTTTTTATTAAVAAATGLTLFLCTFFVSIILVIEKGHRDWFGDLGVITEARTGIGASDIRTQNRRSGSLIGIKGQQPDVLLAVWQWQAASRVLAATHSKLVPPMDKVSK